MERTTCPNNGSVWGRERGIRSGQARRKRTAARDVAWAAAVEAGRSYRAVALESGVSASTVLRGVARTTQMMSKTSAFLGVLRELLR